MMGSDLVILQLLARLNCRKTKLRPIPKREDSVARPLVLHAGGHGGEPYKRKATPPQEGIPQSH